MSGAGSSVHYRHDLVFIWFLGMNGWEARIVGLGAKCLGSTASSGRLAPHGWGGMFFSRASCSVGLMPADRNFVSIFEGYHQCTSHFSQLSLYLPSRCRTSQPYVVMRRTSPRTWAGNSHLTTIKACKNNSTIMLRDFSRTKINAHSTSLSSSIQVKVRYPDRAVPATNPPNSQARFHAHLFEDRAASPIAPRSDSYS